MGKAARITASLVVITAVLPLTLSWSKEHLEWCLPVGSARLTVNGFADQNFELFKSAGGRFALAPSRIMVLITRNGAQDETYVMLGPGPGHLSEGFKGSIRRCESVFISTPFFGFADERSECTVPLPNRDDGRDVKFAETYIEFTADHGERLKVEW